MGAQTTRIYPINSGRLEADLGTRTFCTGPADRTIWNPVDCHHTGTQKTPIDTGLRDEQRATRFRHMSDKRADHGLACHDKGADACSDVFPHQGMPRRKRRQAISGLPFHFGDMPPGTAALSAPAMTRDQTDACLRAPVPPTHHPA